MQSTRATSVLGKRSQRQDQSLSCEQLQTPEPTPDFKRVRTSSSAIDGDGNKENIPPFASNAFNGESSSLTTTPRAARALRRSTTETIQSTPVRAKPRIERSASISSVTVTPTTAISTLQISTPPPTPPTLLPIHSRARALLRATCDDNDNLPGREEERQAVSNFVQSFVDDDERDTHQSLYISGSPGSGKTALINSVLHFFDKELADIKIVTINCMALANVDELWRRMLEELDSSKKSKSTSRSRKQLKGKEALEAVMTALQTKCIVVLDELDHIAPTSQTFKSLLTLPESASGLLRVIGIANTHTLSTNSISSSSGVLTLHFAPYTSSQLFQILEARLASLYKPEKSSAAAKKFLPVPTLTLLTKKVASLTGDVRCLLEVLRGAIDLATSSSSQSSEDVLAAPTYLVTPAHVLAALKSHSPSAMSTPSSGSSSSTSNSEIVAKISSLGLQARLVLLSILLASKRLEAGLTLSATCSAMKRSSANIVSRKDISIETHQLHGYYSSMLSRGDSDLCAPATRNEFIDLISMLEGHCLVNVATATCSSPTKKRALSRSTSFSSVKNKNAATGDVRLGAGVWVDEVLRGLGINKTDSADVTEEEASAIWKQETSRLTKELKVLQAKVAKCSQSAVGFMDATED